MCFYEGSDLLLQFGQFLPALLDLFFQRFLLTGFRVDSPVGNTGRLLGGFRLPANFPDFRVRFRRSFPKTLNARRRQELGGYHGDKGNHGDNRE